MKQTTGIGEVEEIRKFTFNPKEGIDNPALVISDDTEQPLGPVPRLCILRRHSGQSFGFRLCIEKGCRGHAVQQLEFWGVAERSGLRDGDRILEVNGTFVDNIGHLRVARKIRVGGLQLCLLVLSGDEYKRAASQGCDLHAIARTYGGEGCGRPRLCHIVSDGGEGLGFSISPTQGEKHSYTISTVCGGPAEQAGVQNGDRLVWLEGDMTSGITHSALNKKVKKCLDHLTVLVIDRESERSYARCGLPVLPVMANPHNLPYRPRRLHLIQGPDGYGFLLRQEKMRSGHVVHVLRDIDAGSPAESAGMQDGDGLLEVNGEPVEELEHEDIVRRVRQSGRQVTLTVIHARGRDFYTKLGLSPLSFYGDDLTAEAAENESSAPPEILQAHPVSLPCPRLCILHRGAEGFGFHLGCIQHQPGTFIGQVASGGSAERAGLFEGDVVVEVNGQNVEGEYLEDVVTLVKKGGQTLSMLVVERCGYDVLKKTAIPIVPGVVLQSSRATCAPITKQGQWPQQ